MRLRKACVKTYKKKRRYFMKKRLLTILTLIITACIAMTAMAGCGEKKQTDPSTIFINCYSGGYGAQYMRNNAAAFNAMQSEYKAVVLPDNKDDIGLISQTIKAGTAAGDIFMNGYDLLELMRQDLLMDISDVLESESDNGVKIKNKIRDFSDFEPIISYENKFYAMPHNDGIVSMVVDYQLLKDRGWLVKGLDNEISAGKDGQKGTYDDGLPVDMNEWEQMANAIVGASIYPFIVTGQYNFYSQFALDALWAQYDGIDNYIAANTYSGAYTSHSSTVTQLSWQNGYLAFQLAEGRKKAVEFAETYFGNPVYLHPKSMLQTSHRDAQDAFILGYKNASGNPQSAILVDGSWWENEARPMFNSLAENNEPQHAYGVHDYRMMPMPNLPGSKGLDGNGKGSAVSCIEHCMYFAKKQTNEIKIAAVKAFMKYLASDEALKNYTATTGGIGAYDYTLNETQYNGLSPFAKSVWDMYNGENVRVVRPLLYGYSTPFGSLTIPRVERWSSRPLNNSGNAVDFTNPFPALVFNNIPAVNYNNGFETKFTQTFWNSLLSQL